MKKLISGLMLFVFALTLTSCIEMSGQTTLSFKELPNALIKDADGEGQLNPKEIVVLIDGKAYALDAAEKIGAIVEGDEYKEGYNTLLVTYNNVTISFTYLVEKDEPELPAIIDTKWYDDYKTETVFEISTAAELRGLAQLVNAKNVTFAGKTVKLGADIDLAGYAWTPIGEGSRKGTDNKDNSTTDRTFQGTFDGAGFVISNLSDAGYVPVVSPSAYTNSTGEKVYGYVYGLFGMINAGSVTIRDVTLEDVQISGVAVVGTQAYVADSVAGIVGYSGVEEGPLNEITIKNCKVSGEISGYDNVAGIFGRAYSGKYLIEDCTNEANLTALRGYNGKIAGILAQSSFADHCEGLTGAIVNINNCENKGEIESHELAYKGEIYAFLSKGTCKIDGESFDNPDDPLNPAN